MSSPGGTPAVRHGLARNAFHLGIGQVVTTALTMVFSALVARTLGAAEFGLLYLLLSIANFSYVFVDWGHGPYVTREIARHPERSGEMMGSVLAVRFATAVIMCGLGVLFTWILGYDLRTRLLTAYMIVCFMPMYLSLTFSWVFRGRERMEYDALIQVVLKLVTLLFAIAAVSLGGRPVAIIPSYAIGGIVTFPVAMALYRRLASPPLHVSSSTARELVRDGAPMMAMGLAVAVQPYIDANLLYKLTPTEVVGWYGAMWVIAGTLVAPAMILGATMYPRLSRVAADPVEFSRTLRTSFRPFVFVAMLGAVGMYLFADFAIGVVYSQRKFGPAADTLRAFTPALLLLYVDMLFGHAILAVGKATPLAKAKVLAVIVTTALEIALIPLFQSRVGNGGIGIVLAIAGGELVMIVAAVWLNRHVLSPVMAVDFLRALVSGAATVALLTSIARGNPLLGIPLCIATFALLSAVVGLIKREDLEVLTSMVRRRGGVEPAGAA